METQSVDTRPEAEEVLISLYRQAGVAKKFSQVRSLSQAALQLSRRAIARANKRLSEREIDILFVSYHYGEAIAARLDKYLDKIEDEDS